ncbi:MAG TPA: hypothetical protein ENG34_01305 [Candidatus Aenigmarchaeota archaeon]|nr:hypothetical protein [Candidatus Aenigmarchaeota archaeon]
MIAEIILFSLIGLAIGLVAGLTPGIHVNTLIPLILSLSIFIENPYYLATIIISVAVTEVFLDFIPSIFIGAPEADTSLSVLPGHRLLLKGRGYEAIKLTVIGGLGGLVLTLIFISLFSRGFKILYELTRPYVHFLIIFAIIFMVLSERKPKKMLSAFSIMVMSGFLGLIVLNSGLVQQQNALFPTLTGLFGLSTILLSIHERASIPKQEEDEKLLISRKEMIKSLILGCFAGILAGFLPAIGISEAATIVQYLGGSGDARSFLITVSSVNAANDAFSLISLYLVGNPRSGASVAVQRLFSSITFYEVLQLVGVILFVAGIASMLTVYLGRRIPKYLLKISYRKLCISVSIFLVTLVFLLTGIYGLLILFASTSIGILCAKLGIRRSHCMGVLLIPTLLFFSSLTPFVIRSLGL